MFFQVGTDNILNGFFYAKNHSRPLEGCRTEGGTKSGKALRSGRRQESPRVTDSGGEATLPGHAFVPSMQRDIHLVHEQGRVAEKQRMRQEETTTEECFSCWQGLRGGEKVNEQKIVQIRAAWTEGQSYLFFVNKRSRVMCFETAKSFFSISFCRKRALSKRTPE